MFGRIVNVHHRVNVIRTITFGVCATGEGAASDQQVTVIRTGVNTMDYYVLVERRNGINDYTSANSIDIVRHESLLTSFS